MKITNTTCENRDTFQVRLWSVITKRVDYANAASMQLHHTNAFGASLII